MAEGLGNFQQPVWRGLAQGGANGILVITFANAGNSNFVQAAEAGFKAAQSFLETLLESPANRHDFAN